MNLIRRTNMGRVKKTLFLRRKWTLISMYWICGRLEKILKKKILKNIILGRKEEKTQKWTTVIVNLNLMKIGFQTSLCRALRMVGLQTIHVHKREQICKTSSRDNILYLVLHQGP